MTASPTPPDFFAESAKNHDHIVDADKMVPAGLPSEEEMTMLVDGAAYYGADSRSVAHAILDLIRPAFEAKEREIEAAISVAEMNATAGAFWAERGKNAEARALSAEAKLAQAVEARAKLDQRIHNQRAALRQNWQIVEMRRRWLGSDTARIGYLNARRLAKGWRERALDAEATIQVLEARAEARGEKRHG